MALIPRPVHGMLDYGWAVLLGASPWLFGFTEQHVAVPFALAFGGVTLLYSFFTDYELGVVRMIPFPFHLFFDLLAGFLLVTNWLHFAFGGRAGVVFTVFGVIELIVVATSRRAGPTGDSTPV